MSDTLQKTLDKKWLIDVRHKLHTDVLDAFYGTKDMTLRVVREPNQSKNQPAPKLIIVVKTDEQAHELKEKCLNLIAETNQRIKEKLQDSVYHHYEIKYSINIVHSDSDIMLSIHDAKRRKKMDGKKIKAELIKLLTNLENKLEMKHRLYSIGAKDDIKYINECIKSIDDKNKYIFAESTGKSYRLTYYDGNYRKQMSVGNLLIVVSSYDSQILDTPLRKQRSDRKRWLYCINSADLGTFFIYPE